MKFNQDVTQLSGVQGSRLLVVCPLMSFRLSYLLFCRIRIQRLVGQLQDHVHRRFAHPHAELVRRLACGTDGMLTITDWNNRLAELGAPINKTECEMVFHSLDPAGRGAVAVGDVVRTRLDVLLCRCFHTSFYHPS
jgi:hypothetical protein